jgi:hypothetical protein
VIKVMGLDGQCSLRYKKTAEIESPSDRSNKALEERVAEDDKSNLVDEFDDKNKENVSANILANYKEKIPLCKKYPLISSSVSSEMKLIESKNQKNVQLSNETNHIFHPKDKLVEPVEFKLEIKLSAERTLVFTLTKDSNPLKSAIYIADQVEVAPENSRSFLFTCELKRLFREFMAHAKFFVFFLLLRGC